MAKITGGQAKLLMGSVRKDWPNCCQSPGPMSGIHLVPDEEGGRVQAVATDGKELVRTWLDGNGIASEGTLIPDKGLLDTRKTGVNILTQPDPTHLEYELESRGMRAHLGIDVSQYPDYSRVFPEGEPEVTIWVDPDRLGDLLKRIAATGAKSVELRIRDRKTALEMRTDDGTEALMMPMTKQA